MVLLVVDALRYDFAVWDEQLENVGPNVARPAAANRLPVLRRLLREQPNQSLLLPCWADPPTTTMQRIKGFTTGSLPTFLDMGSNFDATAIQVRVSPS